MGCEITIRLFQYLIRREFFALFLRGGLEIPAPNGR